LYFLSALVLAQTTACHGRLPAGDGSLLRSAYRLPGCTLTRAQKYCSRRCYAASGYVRLQLVNDPVGAFGHRSQTVLKLIAAASEPDDDAVPKDSWRPPLHSVSRVEGTPDIPTVLPPSSVGVPPAAVPGLLGGCAGAIAAGADLASLSIQERSTSGSVVRGPTANGELSHMSIEGYDPANPPELDDFLAMAVGETGRQEVVAEATPQTLIQLPGTMERHAAEVVLLWFSCTCLTSSSPPKAPLQVVSLQLTSQLWASFCLQGALPSTRGRSTNWPR